MKSFVRTESGEPRNPTVSYIDIKGIRTAFWAEHPQFRAGNSPEAAKAFRVFVNRLEAQGDITRGGAIFLTL